MKFGCCINDVNQGITLKNLGYDYVELPVAKAMSLTQDEINTIKKGLPVEACNVFIPAELRLTQDVNLPAVKDYVGKAIEQLKVLGVKVIVFGSGGARRISPAFPREKAFEQLVEFLLMASDLAQPYDISIAVEPLNKGECNIINTVIEAAQLAAVVSRSNVQVLADYYHMAIDGQDVAQLEEISKLGCRLIHAHIADPARGRCFPIDTRDYEKFFASLKNINYDNRISIEGSFENFEQDARLGLQVLKSGLE